MGRRKKSISVRRMTVIATRVDVESVRRLEEFEKQHDLSRAQIVRAALKEFMDRRLSARAA